MTSKAKRKLIDYLKANPGRHKSGALAEKVGVTRHYITKLLGEIGAEYPGKVRKCQNAKLTFYMIASGIGEEEEESPSTARDGDKNS